VTWKFLKAHGRCTYKRSEDRDPFCVLVRSQRAAIFGYFYFFFLARIFISDGIWFALECFFWSLCATRAYDQVKKKKKSDGSINKKKKISVRQYSPHKKISEMELLKKFHFLVTVHSFYSQQKIFGRCLSIKKVDFSEWFFFVCADHCAKKLI
jgi:hypothetical protein